jgi:serine/threonine protein kinase
MAIREKDPEPLPDSISTNTKELISKLFIKDPSLRPDAKNILKIKFI